MEVTHLNDLIELEDHYWWHVAKRRLVVQLLNKHFPPPGRIVEGGVGSGRNLREFRQLGYETSGFDLMPEVVQHATTSGMQDVVCHNLEHPWPVEPESIRAVVLLDVLEHLRDPVRALCHAATALAPKGGLIVTVPAYPWLYSDWDRRLGHCQRYTARALRAQVEEAGLSVSLLSHWNSFTLPAAVVLRGLDRMFGRTRGTEFPRVSAIVNRLLIGMANVERRWINHWRVPLGLSLVAVITK